MEILTSFFANIFSNKQDTEDENTTDCDYCSDISEGTYYYYSSETQTETEKETEFPNSFSAEGVIKDALHKKVEEKKHEQLPKLKKHCLKSSVLLQPAKGDEGGELDTTESPSLDDSYDSKNGCRGPNVSDSSSYLDFSSYSGSSSCNLVVEIDNLKFVKEGESEERQQFSSAFVEDNAEDNAEDNSVFLNPKSDKSQKGLSTILEGEECSDSSSSNHSHRNSDNLQQSSKSLIIESPRSSCENPYQYQKHIRRVLGVPNSPRSC